jgi:hypothetical protein
MSLQAAHMVDSVVTNISTEALVTSEPSSACLNTSISFSCCVRAILASLAWYCRRRWRLFGPW